jgi:PAS domain S-box-containing protein
MAASNEMDDLTSVALQTASAVLKIKEQADREIRKSNEELQKRSLELAEALAVMNATLDATNDAILTTNESGRVTNFNENYLVMWRASRALLESAVGPEVWEWSSRFFADPAQFIAGVNRIAAGEAEVADVLELKDGRMIERFSKKLTLNGRGVGRVWSFRDVTERLLAEINSRRLAAIVSSSDDGIVGKDLQSIVTSWNGGAERIFGYTAAEMIGSSIMRLIPADIQSEERTILDRIARGERLEHFETVRVTKRGELIDVSITVSPIKDSSGQVVGASKVVRDISAERKAALTLKRAKEEAEQANRERLQLLESEREARAQAERASHMKDEFLATLSHELRTPLNAVLGWAHILRYETVDADELKQGIETIERNARAQAQIIEDLLDMSRIISGKIQLDVQQVELARVVNDAMETVRAAAQAKSLELRAVVEAATTLISGDANRLQQVFWNLLSNAIKFTPMGGTVRVALRRVESSIEVRVTDSGEGITPEFLPFVFDRFQQADASITRRHGGLGLGLAIVKQLTELHGGTVRVQSAGRGQGSTFVVCLPMTASYTAPAPERSAPRPAPQESQPLPIVCLAEVRVLVVDDEPDARDLIKRLLAKAGATVVMAASAPEAFHCILQQPPDVLVCDIGMPGEDGFALMRRIRALDDPKMADLPAIALTAYARSEDRTNAIRAGFNNHLAKPVEPGEMLAVVASLAARRPH